MTVYSRQMMIITDPITRWPQSQIFSDPFQIISYTKARLNPVLQDAILMSINGIMIIINDPIVFWMIIMIRMYTTIIINWSLMLFGVKRTWKICFSFKFRKKAWKRTFRSHFQTLSIELIYKRGSAENVKSRVNQRLRDPKLCWRWWQQWWWWWWRQRWW